MIKLTQNNSKKKLSLRIAKASYTKDNTRGLARFRNTMWSNFLFFFVKTVTLAKFSAPGWRGDDALKGRKSMQARKCYGCLRFLRFAELAGFSSFERVVTFTDGQTARRTPWENVERGKKTWEGEEDRAEFWSWNAMEISTYRVEVW